MAPSGNRHAFLFLAHGDAGQLARLIGALDHPEFTFFVHVDAKTEIEPFVEALAGFDVHFTSRRIDVWRFCWSMIEATSELMRTATDYGQFGYYTLLSGADYPLMPPDEIHKILSGHDEEMLSFFLLDDRKGWLKRVTRRKYHDHRYMASKKPRTLAVRGRVLANTASRVWHRIGDRVGQGHRKPDDIVLAGGSQWWSLTDECVRYVTDALDRSDIGRFFRYTDGPDELAIQSIVYSSKFRERIKAHDAYVEWQRDMSEPRLPEVLFNYRCIDWSPDRFEVPPEGGDPRGPTTLDDRDFDHLAHSGAILARKMSAERSAGLLDRIDAELLHR